MKGGIMLILGVLVMLFLVLLLVAIVMCTSPVNSTTFFCRPIAPLTELANQFF
jgi:hypothetical protein